MRWLWRLGITAHVLFCCVVVVVLILLLRGLNNFLIDPRMTLFIEWR